MKRTIYAGGMTLAAMLLASAPAQARLDMANAQCTEPNLAPSERVKYCKLDENQGSSGEADQVGAATNLADAERLAGQYADAEAVLTAKLARFPNSLILLIERSLVYAEDNKYDLAVADADKVVGFRENRVTWGNRCWIRGVAGKELDAALDDCNKALAEHKGAANTDSLAFVYYKRGDFKAALDNYNAALDLYSHQWSSLYMRGIVKTRMGDSTGKNDIDEAVRHAPFIADEFAGYGVKP